MSRFVQPTTTIPEERHAEALNNLQTDTWNLYQLLDTLSDVLLEIGYENNPERDRCTRATALAIIGRDMAKGMDQHITDALEVKP